MRAESRGWKAHGQKKACQKITFAFCANPMKTIEEYLSDQHDEELNVLVAETQGWTLLEPEVHPAITYHWAYPPGVKTGNRSLIPLFSTSHDACRELLGGLTEDELIQASNLILKWADAKTDQTFVAALLRATARQICVAWLIVKGVLNESS